MDKISTGRFPAKALNAIVMCLVIVVFLGSACGQVVGACGNKFQCPEILMPPQFDVQKIHIANSVSSAIHAGLSDFPKRPQESTTATKYRYIGYMYLVVTVVVGIGAIFTWLYVRKMQRLAREWEGKYGVQRHELECAREQLYDLVRMEGMVHEFQQYLYSCWPELLGGNGLGMLRMAVDKIEEMWKFTQELGTRNIELLIRIKGLEGTARFFQLGVADRKALEQIIATVEVNPDVGFPKGVKVFTDADGTSVYGGADGMGVVRVYLHTAPPLAVRTIVRLVVDEWLTYGEVVNKLRMAGQSLIEQPKAGENETATTAL